MKILFIAPRIPYPLDRANNVATFELIRALRENDHKVTFCSFKDTEISDNYMEIFTKYCKVHYVEKIIETNIIRAIINIFKLTPYTIAKYYSNGLIYKVLDLISKENYDIVHVDLIQMAYMGEILNKKADMPIILRTHNCETLLMRRRYERERRIFSKIYSYIEWRKLAIFESRSIGIFNKCITMTEVDDKNLKSMNPKIKTAIIPQGVDLSYFRPMNVSEEPFTLVTVSPLDWDPHVEGICWFLENVYPILKNKYKSIRLYIIGKKPKKNIKHFNIDGVITTGFVEDIREYVAKSKVYIVPLLAGSGLRMKILHALSMKKPVVTTSVGCEGMPVKNNKELLIADSPEEFASAIENLLENENKRIEIGEAGYELVKNKYDWKKIVNELEKEYLNIIKEMHSN